MGYRLWAVVGLYHLRMQSANDVDPALRSSTVARSSTIFGRHGKGENNMLGGLTDFDHQTQDAWPIYMQKVKIKGHLAQKLEWKQTNRRTHRQTNGGDCIAY